MSITPGNPKGSWNLRVRHRYGKTCRFSKMGSAGMGTVVDFGTLWHTMYLYRGITGMAQVNYHKGEPNLYSCKTSFVLFYHCFFMVSHVTEPNMALSAARTPCSLTPSPIPL